MRQLKRASPLARIVATLGMLIVIQSLAVLRYGARVTPFKSELPENPIRIFGMNVSVDRFILLGIAVVLTIALHLFYKRTKFGMATTAVAENQRAAASVGLSPDRIAALNWALGSALAAVAGILLAPIVSLPIAVMTNVVLAALAAALVAGFQLPLALAGGLILGILQTEADRFVHTPGASQSLPAIAIVVWMIIHGQALPLHDYFLQRLPSVGSGRIRPGLLAISVLVMALLINAVREAGKSVRHDVRHQHHPALRGRHHRLRRSAVARPVRVGRLRRAGRRQLTDVRGWPFPLTLLAGVVATVPVGAILAPLPSAREASTWRSPRSRSERRWS